MAQVFKQDRYTPVSTQTEIYSDIFTNFDVHPDLGDIVRKKNEEAVKSAIQNLIFTNKYERPFNQNFGSNIKKFLFEPMTPQTQTGLQEEIQNVIQNYEPRANVINVIATPYIDENAYVVTITFSVINNNNPITLNTILYRVR